MSRDDTTTPSAAALVEHREFDRSRLGSLLPDLPGEWGSVVEIFEPRRGGVPAHVAVLAGGLISLGWRVTVAGPDNSPVMDQLAAAGAQVVPLKIAHQPHPNDVLSIRTLRKICQGGVSLIHAHSAKAGLLAACAGRLSGVPSIYSPHSWSFDRNLSRPVRAAYIAYERNAARAHRLIVSVAESERQLGLRHKIKEPGAVRVVPNGLPANPAEIDRDSARARLGISSSGIVAGWVGRYAPQKRPQDLPMLALEFARVGVRLVALGDGLAASPEARRIATAGGTVVADGSDPMLLYAAADLLVSTSAWEAHPITVLEAMRAGLPVVAYAVGGIPEQVVEGRTGYLVRPGARDQLAERVALLARSDLLRMRMGAAGRARQSEQFDLGTMVGRIEALYREVLSGVAARPSPRSQRV
jgi:glycosyltransferase involved in cell wall biosynthesis